MKFTQSVTLSRRKNLTTQLFVDLFIISNRIV